LRIGLPALGIGAGAQREVIDAVATAAEAHGFARVWAGEHVVMVDQSSSTHPYSADGRIAVPAAADWLDPMICLSFAARRDLDDRHRDGGAAAGGAQPGHHRQEGRITRPAIGRPVHPRAGIGWSAEEFAALGVPFDRRASHTEGYAAAMRTIWRGDVASFSGEFINLEAIRVHPRPAGGRAIPTVLGGNSDPALRRVAR